MIMKNNIFKTVVILIFFTISTFSNVSAIELKKKLPKIGGSSGSGISLDDAKTNFTKIFFDLFYQRCPRLCKGSHRCKPALKSRITESGWANSRRSDAALRKSALLCQYLMTQP